jgi:hypothetical protein
MVYDITPPVLDTTTSPTVTVVTSVPTTTLDRVLVQLVFDNVRVTDNQYGQREGLAAGAFFWGVYLATSPTPNPDPNTLRWVAVPVLSPGAHFAVQWSLFSGLDYGPALDKAGTYYVFARFLDGAGNPSSASLRTAKLTLASGYRLPTARAALVLR